MQTLHQQIPEKVRSSSDSGGVLCVREEGSARYVRMVMMDPSKQTVRVEPIFTFFDVFMPSLQ
jgi:ribulose bisphosphate carboxylase small subunit